MNKKWTVEQEEFLKKYCEIKTDEQLVALMRTKFLDDSSRFTKHTIKKKRQRMGLKKAGNKNGSKRI